MRKATIHLDAIEHNYLTIKQMAPHSKIMAMVKSNAYGHGIVPIARALPHADALGVACLSEAIPLRQAGITQPIVLISGFHHSNELPLIDHYHLDLVIHHPEQIPILTQYKFDQSPQIWLKINTGMNRLGFLPDQVEAAFDVLSKCPWIKQPINWMTHFANSDDANADSNLQQLALFNHLVKLLPGEKTVCNSGGILHFPQAHLDWVRPGIMLYGISPLTAGCGADLGLKPVMRLEASLLSTYQLKKGETVGYGSIWRAPETMPVGIISFGYGDGYPREAGAQSAGVCIHDTVCPLIGRVSMDLMAVDLRSCSHAKTGDPVLIWGKEWPVERTAAAVNTIAYELVCHVTSRVEFEYADNR